MQNILLQTSVWFVVFGSIISIVGVLALVLSLLRKKRRDLSLAAFGAFSLLYGMRMLIDIQIQSYSSSPPPQILIVIMAFIAYTVPVPLSGFLLHLFGRGWKNSMLWAFRGTVVFACVGIVSDILQAEVFSLTRLNNVLIIVWAIVVTTNAFLSKLKKIQELRVVLAGFLVFGLFAANANLVELNILPWEWNEEAYGFLAFLFALGYVAANRFFSNESRLKAMEREMEIAHKIQLSILPRVLPEVPGLVMAARYVPMDSVAGDFYDALVQDRRYLCVLIADVSGHGVGAALIASMLKIAFASQQGRLSDPSQVLEGMNQALYNKLENNFVTAACISLDFKVGTLSYAAAGHPPLLIYRKSEQKILELGNNGLILGPFGDSTYPLTTVLLESGDRIVLYTDGIIETRNTMGDFFGEQGFKEFIKSQKDLSLESFVDSLLGHLSAWSTKAAKAPLDDDLTLLVIDFL